MPPIEELVASILKKHPYLSREEAERRVARMGRAKQTFARPSYYNPSPVNYGEEEATEQIFPFKQKNVQRLRGYNDGQQDYEEVRQRRLERAVAAKAAANELSDRRLAAYKGRGDIGNIPPSSVPQETFPELPNSEQTE